MGLGDFARLFLQGRRSRLGSIGRGRVARVPSALDPRFKLLEERRGERLL